MANTQKKVQNRLKSEFFHLFCNLRADLYGIKKHRSSLNTAFLPGNLFSLRPEIVDNVYPPPAWH